MKLKLEKRALLSVIAIALISLVLWGLADGKSDAMIVLLATTGIITTSCIWFSMAWCIFDVKPLKALPAVVICLAPYALTSGLDKYIEPYYYNGGGNQWAWIMDSYCNIFFNGSFNLLSALPDKAISKTAILVLVIQILLPFALAFILKLYQHRFRSGEALS